jgi:hypothetical protein
MNVPLAAFMVGALLAACIGTTVGAQEVPYGLGEWPSELGNHRARIQVAAPADAVRVHLPWRRRDSAPEAKRVLLFDAATGRQVRNVAQIAINREYGDLVFQPSTAPGEYYVYDMPYTTSGSPYFPVVTYPPPQDTADPSWLERSSLTPGHVAEGRWKALPEAKVLEFQARGAFHRFDPMEIIATARETENLLARHPGEPYLLFPEDRERPIRMTDDLPLRWAQRGPSGTFAGEARRGEFYVFQVGVWAARQPVEEVAIRFAALRGKEGATIPASAFRCFNLGGSDWLGRPFRKKVSVEKGHIGALWFGVAVPEKAAPGVYTGSLTIRPKNAPARTVRLSLTISSEVAADGGDGDLWRLSRLRWLDSTIGLDDEVVAPYTPLKITGQTVECLGRQVRFAKTGLPDSIRSRGHEILSLPMALVVQTPGGVVAWKAEGSRILRRAPGAVIRQADATGGPFALRCWSKMEADGYINFRAALTARQGADVNDIRLQIPLRREIATYMMGMGRKGGYRPQVWWWTWDIDRANNSLWLGDVEAGLHCKLKGTEDTWDLYNLRTSGIPTAWGNGGRGGCTVGEDGADTVLICAYSGPRRLKPGETLHFNFGLLITPVKPLDPAHWSQRYYHAYVSPETAVQSGADIINIHQGNELNPNINYPFRTADKLAAYVKNAHALGVKVKIYYTVRELSNYVAEMWPLRSLGYEVFADGPGGGDSWLQEHLVSHYAPAWHTPLPDGTVDAAIATVGLSRWHNYYLEGLRWLLQNAQIDGLYLDGIGYDREIMKRVRKVLDRTRPGCLIDFHSGNNFHPEYGLSNCANQYMEHFPYVNSLWFGEGFDYNETPDYWLVEVSGIPFGLFGEMLQDNGNPWRGMVYGMTARYYSGADPKHIWKLWDDFGIADAKMLGYWNPACPVRADHPDVLATAYVKPGRALISLASWAKETVRCHLQIDWKALGLDPANARLTAPAIPGFQPQARFTPAEAISVEPGRGWLLLLE